MAESVMISPPWWPLSGVLVFLVILWLGGRFLGKDKRHYVIGFGLSISFLPIPLPFLGFTWAVGGMIRGLIHAGPSRGVEDIGSVFLSILIVGTYVSVVGVILSFLIRVRSVTHG